MVRQSVRVSNSNSGVGGFKKFAMVGSIIHSIGFGELELIENGMLVYGANGIIESLTDLKKNPVFGRTLGEDIEVVDYSGKLILPGFIDAHCHAPQYVFTGTGMDLPLLEWLEKYTFPCEARFANLEFARSAYEKSIKRHLKSGTTFASYFATIHKEAGKVLVDVINEVGQRAFVGKVSMDRNSPDFYIEQTEQGADDAEEFARFVLSLSAHGQKFLNAVDASEGKVPSFEDTTAAVASKLKHPRTVSFDNLHSLSGRATTKQFKSSSFTAVNSIASAPTAALSSLANRRVRTVSMCSSTDMLSQLVDIDEDLDEDEEGNDGMKSAEEMTVPLADDQVVEPITAVDADYDAGIASKKRSFASVEGRCEGSTEFQNPSKHLNKDCKFAVRPTLLNQPHTPLVMPCITPRFVPTCTSDMMRRLGDISNKYGLPVQSHMSESPNEIAWVAELHPECDTYAAVYEQYGLLHSGVYMAHCCHSSVKERELLSRTGTGVVHCASSNFMLSSGVLDTRQFLEEGIKVALGTDVAGGYSASMLDAIRQTITASRVKEIHAKAEIAAATSAAAVAVASAATDGATSILLESAAGSVGGAACDDAVSLQDSLSAGGASDLTSEDGTGTAGAPAADSSDAVVEGKDSGSVKAQPGKVYRSLSYAEAFHLATVGGAEVMGMGNVVGNFEVGKKMDCLVVDVCAEDSPIDLFDDEGPLEHFQKFIFLGDDRNIQHVYVDGRRVI